MKDYHVAAIGAVLMMLIGFAGLWHIVEIESSPQCTTTIQESS